jgi:hypothetical protein
MFKAEQSPPTGSSTQDEASIHKKKFLSNLFIINEENESTADILMVKVNSLPRIWRIISSFG